MKWPLLGKSRNLDRRTGIVVTDQCTALVQVDSRSARPRLLNCNVSTHPSADIARQSDLLTQLAKQHHLGDADCHAVMPLGSYHLLLIEAPEVPQNELRAAVRWRIRDLIDFHVDDAVLDVFDAPAAATRGEKTHLYVVVSRSADVKRLSDQLQDAGIGLGVIDIPELALLNIAKHLPEDQQGVAMLYFGQERGLIALCRNQTLYLARTLDLGEQRIQEAFADGHTEAMYDALALEVQRTMDYYDRHFQQAPINHLVVAPLSSPMQDFTEQLHNRLGLQARMLDINQIVDGAEQVPVEQAGPCLLAIGAALRSESKTL